MSFGERLRKYRTRSGLSQRDLGEAAGLDRTTVAKIEVGTRGVPDRDKVLAMADAMRLTPGDTDALLGEADYDLETITDIPGVDSRDEWLRSFLHALCTLRREGEPRWVSGFQEALEMMVVGALQERDIALPPSGIAGLAQPTYIAAPLTDEEERLDDILTEVIAGTATSSQLKVVETAVLDRDQVRWEIRRRVAEALPSIVAADEKVAFRLAEHLRDDYDPVKWRTDVRRRVVEATPALYEADVAQALKLLKPHSDDEIYVAMATVEALTAPQMGSIPRQTVSSIRRAVSEVERRDQAGVIDFVSSLIDLISDKKYAEALAMMRLMLRRERVFRICVSRNLWRLLGTSVTLDALWMALYFARHQEGRPAEHANVRRPLAMQLPYFVPLVKSDDAATAILSKVLVQTLAQDIDILIRRGLADELPHLAEIYQAVARTVVVDHFLQDSDPYVKRRASQSLSMLGLTESNGY